MTFKAPFRPAGFFDPTAADSLENCDLSTDADEYRKENLQLAPGCMVTIAAFIMPETDNFIIDFMSPPREVAMHLRAKVNDGHLTMNSTAAGKWQSEIRVKNLPLRKGRTFYMSVLVTSKAYLIAFNDEHFAVFPHRLPYDTVNTLAVYKGLKVAAVYYEIDYKYSHFRFTVDPAAESHLSGGCASQRLLGKSSARSAVYPQLPYRMTLPAHGGEGGDPCSAPGSFIAKGACLLMTLRPNYTSKGLTISFTQPDAKPAMDLELFVSHSQGRVHLHSAKESKEFSLWSLIGLNRRRHTDVCVCCSDTDLRLFVGHRPVFQLSREQLQPLWDRVPELNVKGEADLIVVHFCRL